jgi:flagellar biosynthesis protein FlhF
MNIKRFVASDTRKALNMVREKLGPDAIIISNRSVDDGVEILAAEDFDEELTEQGELNTDNATFTSVANSTKKPARKPTRKQTKTRAKKSSQEIRIEPEKLSFAEKIKSEIKARSGKKENKIDTDIEDKKDSESDTPALPSDLFDIRKVTERTNRENIEQQVIINNMRDEIDQLRGQMESQFTKIHAEQKPQQSPIHKNLLKQFQCIGLNKNLSGALVNTMQDVDSLTPQAATREALALLTRQIITSNDDILTEGGVIALIGPAGAGKTITLAKLASQFIQRHQSKDIILVSTDTYRVGAQEQLMAYGRLLGVPVLKAKDQTEIRQILSAIGDKKLVLVDSGSLTQNDLRDPQNIPTVQAQLKGIKHYLVLPATMQSATLNHIVIALSASDVITGGIITKVDEAINLGASLAAAIQHKLPIAYWCDGQKISSHLYAAKAQHLIAKAVTMVRITEPASNATANITTGDTTIDTSNHAQ